MTRPSLLARVACQHAIGRLLAWRGVPDIGGMENTVFAIFRRDGITALDFCVFVSYHDLMKPKR
jgi:hypothetical protein